VLYGWSRWRGAAAPSRANWIAAAIVGTFLLIGGNGGVVWAEQWVPSGLAALLVATEPFWIVLFDWLRPGGARPAGVVVAGLISGFVGVLLLVGPSNLVGGDRVHLLGALALVMASASWAVGSIYSARGAPLPASPMLNTGMQMLIGGALFFVLASATGEWDRLDASTVSLKSVLALLYLLVFGAIVGFTAYMYLLKHTTPARASTYAYVNPVIAVFLGWALGGEALSGRVVFAMLAIVGAVALITSHRPSGAPEALPRPARKAAGEGLPRVPEATVA
ncbi:MAG: EamA family transporter, partial [Gemmatimonadetes bacterium]|nr:EamA family transporter [Gemmatimonadota bacterium]